jgi:hypothetical protein
MNARTYLVTSGSLFGAVAIAHLLRVVNGWAVVAGPWSIPMWVSWFGTIVPALLAFSAFRLASRSAE